jgi:hypothetical protein
MAMSAVLRYWVGYLFPFLGIGRAIRPDQLEVQFAITLPTPLQLIKFAEII